MSNISFAGPENFESSKIYDPKKIYIVKNVQNKPIVKINKKQLAANLYYDFYINNKEKLPSKAIILKHRYKIENLILQGESPEIAFQIVLFPTN